MYDDFVLVVRMTGEKQKIRRKSGIVHFHTKMSNMFIECDIDVVSSKNNDLTNLPGNTNAISKVKEKS